MKCVDCKRYRRLANERWCEAGKRSKRITDEDAHKDVPCNMGKVKGERVDDEPSRRITKNV